MKSCQEILGAARNSVAELEKVQWKVSDAERRVNEKANSLESRLDGSDAELQTVIANFENTMQGRARELRAMQQKADGLAQEVAQLRDQMATMNSKKGQAVLLQESQKKLKDDQLTASRNMQRKYNLPQPTNNWTPVAARDYLQHLNNEV
jgi:chromosome segregation ATPase